MTIGALRQVVPESLEFYFEIVARGTRSAKGRVLRQTIVSRPCPLRRLRQRMGARQPVFRCTECGGAGAAVSGEEFEVESIDVEEDSRAPH